jgi:hypothetical protein
VIPAAGYLNGVYLHLNEIRHQQRSGRKRQSLVIDTELAIAVAAEREHVPKTLNITNKDLLEMKDV